MANLLLLILQVILVWSMYTFTAPTYGSVEYPQWAIALGWCMTAFCLMWIPIVAVWKIMKANGSLWQVGQELLVCLKKKMQQYFNNNKNTLDCITVNAICVISRTEIYLINIID